MNELIKHLEFFEPVNWMLVTLGEDCFSKEVQEILLLARSIFSSYSRYPYKELMTSILKHKITPSPSNSRRMSSHNSQQQQVQPLADNMDFTKISTLSQIASVVPRDFVIYHDLIFYKKLVTLELIRRRTTAPEEETLSTYDLVHGGLDKRVNKAQKVYVLFDNSSSMAGENLNKLYAAKAIALEYLRQAQPENPQIYFRSFTNRVSPLLRSERARDIKKIVKHIAHLHTADCHQTEIGKAILQAIEDIRQDSRMEKAEILVITDGLGPIPKNLRQLLGKIKLHVILICGLDIDQMLKLYPNRSAWEQAESGEKPREMPPFWHAWGFDTKGLSLPDPGEDLELMRRSKLTSKQEGTLRKMEILLALSQIYQLQEVVDTFIPLHSILGEKFNLFNPHELKLIVEYRKILEQIHHQNLSISVKSEMYHRAKFMIKYLNTLLSRNPPQEMREQIKEEINHFIRIQQSLLKDSWFVSIMTSLDRQRERIKGLGENGQQQDRGALSLSKGRLRATERVNVKVFLVIIIRKIGRLYRWLLQARPWLVNLFRFCRAHLKKRVWTWRKNKLRDKLKGCIELDIS